MSNLSNAEDVQKFLQVYNNLKKLTSCSICSQIAVTPLQLNCSHIFCESCLNGLESFLVEHGHKHIKCPTCRVVVTKKRKLNVKRTQTVVDFVKNCRRKLETALGTDFSDAPNVEEIKEKLSSNENEVALLDKTSSSIDIIPPTFTSSSLKRSRTTSAKKPAKRSKQSSKSKSKKVLEEHIESNTLTEEEKCDVFIQSSSENNSKLVTQTKIIKKIENVINDSNNINVQSKILEWLNDGKNNFDRVSQTQDSNTPKSFNLASASQTAKTKELFLKGRYKAVKKKPKTNFRRTKSLDILIKKSTRKKPERHSIGDADLENLEIKEVESDDEQIMDLLAAPKEALALLGNMEEQFLLTIENEATETDVISPTNNIDNDLTNKKENIVPEVLGRLSTGWERLKETEKTFKKSHKSTFISPNVPNKGRAAQQGNDRNKEAIITLTDPLEEKLNELINGNEEIFSCCTQKIYAPLPVTADSVQEELIFTVPIQNCEKDNELSNERDEQLNSISKKSKFSNIAMDSTVTVNTSNAENDSIAGVVHTNVVEKAVQTDTNSNIVQEKRKKYVDQSIQTNILEEPKGFHISSTEMFNTLKVEHAEVQTEKFSCPNCNCLLSEYFIKQLSQHGPSMNMLSEVLIGHPETLKLIKEAQMQVSSTSRKSPEIVDMSLSESINNLNKTAEDEMESELIITLPSPKKPSAFRKLSYSNTKKKFKRIRSPPTSDSDSENLNKRQKLGFIEENISIDVTRAEGKKNSESFSLENCDQFDCDKYLEKILNKYENNKNTDKVSEPKPKSLEKCDMVLSGISILNDNTGLETTNTNPAIVVEAPKKNKPFNPFSIDIISQDTTLVDNDKTLVSNYPKDPLMNDGLTRDSYDMLMKEFNNEIFDDEVNNEVNNITTSIEKQNKDLRNLSAVRLEELDMFNNENDVPDTPSNKSEELFETELDEDIVETTPQKPKLNVLEKISQRQQQLSSHNSPEVITETFMFDEAVPPPPGFGDDDENIEESFQETEGLVQTLNRNISPKSTNFESEMKFPDLSPIKSTRSVNIIQISERAASTPLTFVKPKTNPMISRMSTPKNKQKNLLDFVRVSQNEKSPMSVSSCLETTVIDRKPCVASTRLTKEQVIAISALTNKKLVTYTNTFSKSVTHMVVCVNSDNRLIDHTIKYVSAVAAGIWVVNFSWVQDCLKQNTILPAEKYEVLDVSGLPGPRKSRLTRSKSPLLKGYKIFAAPPFLSTTQADVENVIKLLGGHIAHSADELLESDEFIKLIVTEARATQDFDMYEIWLESLKVVTVDIEWLSRSVGQYKLLSLRPFALCSDDNITSLGYPEDLLLDLSFSFSQGTYTNSK